VPGIRWVCGAWHGRVIRWIQTEVAAFIECRSCVNIPFTPGWFACRGLAVKSGRVRRGSEANVRAAD